MTANDSQPSSLAASGGANASVRDDGSQDAAKRRRRVLLVVQLIGSGLGIALLFLIGDPARAVRSVAQEPLWVVGACVLAALAAILVSSLRWQNLLRAYGAERPPSVARLFHLNMVGFFYNLYVPGGVGGDVIRGIVSRDSFGVANATAGLAVVLVERVLGLTALLFIASVALLVRPVQGLPSPALVAAFGCASATIGVGIIASTRRMARYTPGRVRGILEQVPGVSSWPRFALALLLSIGGQLATAAAGWFVLYPFAPHITIADAAVIAPIAAAAAFLPITVGGVGARESAFAVLSAQVLGIDSDQGVAASLTMWFSYLLTAGIGGLLQLALPLTPQKSDDVPR